MVDSKSTLIVRLVTVHEYIVVSPAEKGMEQLVMFVSKIMELDFRQTQRTLFVKENKVAP